jgi:putative endonuclease
MNILGREGEKSASHYLERKGYRILERNFRTPFGEIDIIARDGDVTVFVEVKTRTDEDFGPPFEAVHHRKREKMKRVALSYLKRFRVEVPARFDVLSSTVKDGTTAVEHIRDAFEV